MKVIFYLLFIFSFSAMASKNLGPGLETICTEILKENSARSLVKDKDLFAGAIDRTLNVAIAGVAGAVAGELKSNEAQKGEKKIEISDSDRTNFFEIMKIVDSKTDKNSSSSDIRKACESASSKILTHKSAQRLNKLLKYEGLDENNLENDLKLYGKKDRQSVSAGETSISKSSTTCKTSLDLNGTFGESCSRLPSKVTDHSGDSNDQTFSLLDRFSFVYSKDITSLSGRPENCVKCLEKFSISNKGAEGISNGYQVAQNKVAEIYHEKIVEGKLQLAFAAAQNIADLRASREKFADGGNYSQNCLEQKNFESSLRKKCGDDEKKLLEAKLRISKALNSMGDNWSIENLQDSFENGTRKIKSESCKGSFSSRDAYQYFLMNEMYAPSISEEEVTLPGLTLKLVDETISKTNTISQFCAGSGKKTGSVDTLFEIIFAQHMNGSLKGALTKVNDKLNEETGRQRGVSNMVLASAALDEMRKADPLLRMVLLSGESFCAFLDKKPEGASVASLVVNSDHFSPEELFNNHKEILNEYEGRCTSYIDELVESACSSNEGMDTLVNNVMPDQIKGLMDERIEQIHSSQRDLSELEKSEILGIGKMSCEVNSLSGGDDDGVIFKPLSAKDSFEYGQISKSEMSDLFRKKLSEEMDNSRYVESVNFLDYKGDLFCEGSAEVLAAKQHVNYDVYGEEPDEDVVNENIMRGYIENEGSDGIAYLPDSIAKKLSQGKSPSSILKEMEEKRKAKTLGAIPSSGFASTKTTDSLPVNEFAEEKNDLTQSQVVSSYVNPKEFIDEVKKMDSEEKLIDDLVSGNSEADQLEKALAKDRLKEQDKLDELNRQLAEIEKKIADAKKAEQSRKASELEDQKKKIKEEIASTQKNLNFLDKENQKLADKRYEEKIKDYDRKPSGIAENKVDSNTGSFRRGRTSNQAGAQLSDVVKSVNDQVNEQTNFIKLEVAPSEILSIIKNVDASGIDTLFLGENKDELRFIKIPGQTNYIDVRLLDEDTRKELFKKLEISSSSIVESGKEAREKIDKIVEDSKKDGGRKVLFENLTSFIKSSVASGDKQAAAIAASEILK